MPPRCCQRCGCKVYKNALDTKVAETLDVEGRLWTLLCKDCYSKLSGGGSKKMSVEWIQKAVETIKSGVADKLTKDNVTIYRVGTIIRIDIKE